MTVRARPNRPYTDGKAIFIGIGANLPHPHYGPPADTCRAAVLALERTGGIAVRKVSPWYESAPHPPDADQPWYVNGVVMAAGDLAPANLLDALHAVEADFGRERSVRNAARVLDLDLIDYRGLVADGAAGGPVLPHPRMTERAFVLLPLRDLAPDWRHPVTGETVDSLIDALPPGQEIRRAGKRG